MKEKKLKEIVDDKGRLLEKVYLKTYMGMLKITSVNLFDWSIHAGGFLWKGNPEMIVYVEEVSEK